MAHGGESPNDSLIRWRLWIERISNDLIRSRHYHRAWNETRVRWNRNQSLRVPNDAKSWILQSHAGSIALAIRRETDRDSRSISLRNLLDQLERKARFVTRAAYVALSAPDHRGFAEVESSKWLEPGTDHLDPAIPAADLDDLVRETTIVREYVNRSVAHRDGGAVKDKMTLGDLSLSLDRIEAIAQKYNLILRGTSYGTYEPVRQFDESLFFRRPWERARWKKSRWPPGTVERIGEFRETFDAMKRTEYFALVGARHRIREEFAKAWKWEAPTDSPIRTTLATLGFPSSDAAVMWVRDRLLQRDTPPTS